jgi:hypothetical protein
MVRNFDIVIDNDNGINRMMISGFLNYDEALQYARLLYKDETMAEKLQKCHRIIISNDNLKLLGTKYSYRDYEQFFEEAFAPLPISNEELLSIPETIIQKEETGNETENTKDDEEEDFVDDLFFENTNTESDNGGFDFEEDFYR